MYPNMSPSPGIRKGELFYNVKDYGAIGNGVTVNTTSIQNAINAANAAGGGTVYFPVGTYLTDSLTMYSNITILGANREKSIVKLISVPTSGWLFNCSGAGAGALKTKMVFERICLTHRADYTTSTHLIYADYTTWGKVHNCVFESFSYSAVYLKNIDTDVAYYASWQITGNVFRTGRAGGSRGITLASLAEYVTVDNNIFSMIAFGVYVDDAANASILNNHMTGAEYGIYITHTTAGTNNGKTLIMGNKINHCGVCGIYGALMRATFDRGITINGNHLLYNYGNGIRLCGTYSSLITGNRLSMSNVGEHAISIEDYSTTQIGDYNSIIGNLVTKGDIQDLTTGGHNTLASNVVSIA